MGWLDENRAPRARGQASLALGAGIISIAILCSLPAVASATVTAGIETVSREAQPDGSMKYTFRSTSTDTSSPDGVPAKEEWDPEYRGESSFTPVAEGRTFTLMARGPKSINVAIRATGHDGQQAITYDGIDVPPPEDNYRDLVWDIPSQLDVPRTTFTVTTRKAQVFGTWYAAGEDSPIQRVSREVLADGRNQFTFRLQTFPMPPPGGTDVRIHLEAYTTDRNSAQHEDVYSRVMSAEALTEFVAAPTSRRTSTRIIIDPVLTFCAATGYSGTVRIPLQARVKRAGKWRWKKYRTIRRTFSGQPNFNGACERVNEIVPVTLPRKYRKADLRATIVWFTRADAGESQTTRKRIHSYGR